MNIVSDSGWQWELVKWSDSKPDNDPSAYYRYAGCHAALNLPVRTGVWSKVFTDAAYYYRADNGSLGLQANLTYPSR